MPLPIPEPGLVIPYSYLWMHGHMAGRDEGVKTRPCVIILAVEEKDGDTIVTVAPITHRPPADLSRAIDIPLAVKKNLGLDCDRSRLVLGEFNQFAWPGHDIRPIPGSQNRYDYGYLPPRLCLTRSETEFSI